MKANFKQKTKKYIKPSKKRALFISWSQKLCVTSPDKQASMHVPRFDNDTHPYRYPI